MRVGMYRILEIERVPNRVVQDSSPPAIFWGDFTGKRGIFCHILQTGWRSILNYWGAESERQRVGNAASPATGDVLRALFGPLWTGTLAYGRFSDVPNWAY
jgi:hypothetical protein